jgi:hypothetical protein
VLRNYNIHHRLAHRSGIVLYAARDDEYAREVWLWRLLEFSEGFEAPPDEVLAEARSQLLALRHPSIISVLEVESDPDGVVAVLEPVPGEPLDGLLTAGVLDLETFSAIAVPVLGAIRMAHTHGVGHGALEAALVFHHMQQDGSRFTSVLGFGIVPLIQRLRGQPMQPTEADDLAAAAQIFHLALAGSAGKSLPLSEVRPDLPPAIEIWLSQLSGKHSGQPLAHAGEALSYFYQALGYQPNQPSYGYSPEQVSWYAAHAQAQAAAWAHAAAMLGGAWAVQPVANESSPQPPAPRPVQRSGAQPLRQLQGQRPQSKPKAPRTWLRPVLALLLTLGALAMLRMLSPGLLGF